mgnify:CR=1 FL=1
MVSDKLGISVFEYVSGFELSPPAISLGKAFSVGYYQCSVYCGLNNGRLIVWQISELKAKLQILKYEVEAIRSFGKGPRVIHYPAVFPFILGAGSVISGIFRMVDVRNDLKVFHLHVRLAELSAWFGTNDRQFCRYRHPPLLMPLLIVLRHLTVRMSHQRLDVSLVVEPLLFVEP